MKRKFILIVSAFFLTCCAATELMYGRNQSTELNLFAGLKRNNSPNTGAGATVEEIEKTVTLAQLEQPKTVRDFFNLLPQKYFTLEGCVDKPTKENCDKARARYLKSFLEIEDTANGYMKGGCDGAQSCFTMALFKRRNGTYIVAINKLFETGEETHFLEYKNGNWKDIGAQIIPEYSKRKTYELPRQGTTIAVYELKETDEGFIERSEKLYDLVWKNGIFSVKK